ncbi:hypothetical protein [uncultured Roseibium sp.]|uniref:hypothetical protein n=1 Tax=uncultured Roseibium sp. TaxID=1936171 RepID=UPI002601ED50|nr:hypothetical protein [uncultured Roseibium sp.]
MRSLSAKVVFNLPTSVWLPGRSTVWPGSLARKAAMLACAALLTLQAVPTVIAQTVEASPSNPIAQYDGTLSAFNKKNNEEQIDTPAELTQSHTAPHEKSADDLSRELSNPNSPLAKLQFETRFTAFEGDLPGADDEWALSTVFQPIFPFPISADGTTNFFLRPGVPIIWRQPSFNAGSNRFDAIGGIGDIGFDAAIGKSFDNGVIAVAGIQGTLPTGTDSRLTGGQLRLGPEAVLGYINKTGYAVAFPQHQWNVAGWEDEAYAVSNFEFNAGLYLPNAWTVFTNPVFEYDWMDNQWTVPVNLGVRKVVNVGKMPVQFVLKGDYYLEKDDTFGEEFAVTLQVTPVVQNFIYNALIKN